MKIEKISTKDFPVMNVVNFSTADYEGKHHEKLYYETDISTSLRFLADKLNEVVDWINKREDDQEELSKILKGERPITKKKV